MLLFRRIWSGSPNDSPLRDVARLGGGPVKLRSTTPSIVCRLACFFLCVLVFFHQVFMAANFDQRKRKYP